MDKHIYCCHRCGDIFESDTDEDFCEPCRAMKAKSAKYSNSAQKVVQAAKIMVTCVDCGTVFECRAATPTERCTVCRRKRAREKQKEYRRKEREEFSALLKSSGYKPPTETVFLCQLCFCEFRAPTSSHPKYCESCRKTAYEIKARESDQARRKKKERRKAPQERIADIIKKAAAEGLTYGQYMARKGK